MNIGDILNPFNQSALEFAGHDVITSSYEIAVITSLPSCYERGVEQDKIKNKVLFARGGFIGKPGDKVTLDVEVLRSVYSQNYNVYFITAITDADQPIFFAHKKEIAANTKIKLAGTVKMHRDASTQLNRVKIKE